MGNWLHQCRGSQISRMLEPKLFSVAKVMPVVSTNNKDVCSPLLLPSSLLLLPPISRTIQEPAGMAVWKIRCAESQPQNHRTQYRKVGLEMRANWEITNIIMKWLGKPGLIVHNCFLESTESRRVCSCLWLVEYSSYHFEVCGLLRAGTLYVQCILLRSLELIFIKGQLKTCLSQILVS